MKENIINLINVVLKNRGKETISDIHMTNSLINDIGLDSLDLAELTVRIEAEYDIDIFEDGIVNTVDEIIQKIDRK